MDTETAHITAADEDLPDLPDVAGFEGELFSHAWVLDRAGERVEREVNVGLRAGVYAEGGGSGFLEFIDTRGKGVSMFLPAPVARELCEVLFRREWWDVP